MLSIGVFVFCFWGLKLLPFIAFGQLNLSHKTPTLCVPCNVVSSRNVSSNRRYPLLSSSSQTYTKKIPQKQRRFFIHSFWFFSVCVVVFLTFLYLSYEACVFGLIDKVHFEKSGTKKFQLNTGKTSTKANFTSKTPLPPATSTYRPPKLLTATSSHPYLQPSFSWSLKHICM